MFKIISKVLIVTICFIYTPVFADIAVLVHGYQASGHDWRKRGVLNQLHARSWYDGGHFTSGPQGVIGPENRGDAVNIVYTLDLPDEAPIMYQADVLNRYLQKIRQLAEQEKLILIGYSAGGVVARATMVLHPEHRVSKLITIAAPHRGTEAAYFANILARSPMGDMADWIGLDSLPRSKHLFADLKPVEQGTFLFWLNLQPHPMARYISIVRAEARFTGGDVLIPRHSQDMRYIPAIGRRANVVPTPGDHELTFRDGIVLAKILNYGY